MAARPAPANGDIVMREDQRDGAIVYVLCTIPGGDQLATAQYEHCVEHALAFARRAGVCAWRQTGSTIELIHDFRRVALL
jgi:hypothetical protein